jgi:ABC-type xylose transport system permease subunit
MKVFSMAFIGLLLVDAVLSVVDNATPTNPHLSKWTTITLCLGSVFVFVAGAIAALVVRFRPRWPILLSSGLYSLYVASLLVPALLGIQQTRTPAEQQVRSLVVAGLQLLLATGCLLGLLRGSANQTPLRDVTRVQRAP